MMDTRFRRPGRETARVASPGPSTSSWRRSPDRREKMVRTSFLPKLKRVLAQVPFAEDLLSAYYAVLDRRTPFAVRATLVGALAYFVLPFDIVPDFLAGPRLHR